MLLRGQKNFIMLLDKSYPKEPIENVSSNVLIPSFGFIVNQV